MKNISCAIIVILLVLGPALPGCDQSKPQDEAKEYQLRGDEEFTIVTAPLSLNEDDEYGTVIPYGSVIYHWDNDITEVYGPDNIRIFIAKDSEATMHPVPSAGLLPATHVLQVPNNSHIRSEGDTGNTRRVYLEQTVILTIVDYRSEEK